MIGGSSRLGSLRLRATILQTVHVEGAGDALKIMLRQQVRIGANTQADPMVVTPVQVDARDLKCGNPNRVLAIGGWCRRTAAGSSGILSGRGGGEKYVSA